MYRVRSPCRCCLYHQCMWYRSFREHGNYERIGNQIFQQNNLKETEHDPTKSIVVKYIVMEEVESIIRLIILLNEDKGEKRM